jgi:hypothetical protein
MKRTAATIVMLAGLGGCASPETTDSQFGQAYRGQEVPGVVGPMGEPVVAAAQMPTKDAKVVRADLKTPAKMTDSGIKQTAGYARVGGGGGGAHISGLGGGCAGGQCGAGMDANAYGPLAHGAGMMLPGHGGILPVPAMGPPGAVAAIGAIGAPGSGMYGPMYMNQRTSIRFAGLNGIAITWLGPDGRFVEPPPLQSPARYNFPQGNIYRLRLSNIPTRPGKVYYPTLEVYPATPRTLTFLSHTTVPVTFTEEDFARVNGGNLVIKVIYLPSPEFQELGALGNAEEIRSDELEPGVNPVDEANRRGTVLAVVRIGNIDLQDPNTPPVDAPPGILPGGPVVPRTMTVPKTPEPGRLPGAPGTGSGGGVKSPGILPASSTTMPSSKGR